MREDKIGDGAAEDDPEPLGIDAPAHNAKRIWPKVFAGILDLRRTAIACTQHYRGSTVTKQTDRDNIGFGKFVVAQRQRTEFYRHDELTKANIVAVSLF